MINKKHLITSLVPSQLNRLIEEKYGLEWLKLFDLVWVGGAALSSETITKCIKEKINLSPCYGATETAAMITALKPSEFLNGNSTSGELLKDIQLNIYEIKRPELDAFLVASSVARQIENRISYKRAIKMAIAASIRMNAEGIKIQISGRLNGAEMARSEHYKEGRIPLSTFRADIDYAMVEAHTTYGRIGIKVWIMKGEVYGKRDLNPLVGLSKKQGKNNRRKRT